MDKNKLAKEIGDVVREDLRKEILVHAQAVVAKIGEELDQNTGLILRHTFFGGMRYFFLRFFGNPFSRLVLKPITSFFKRLSTFLKKKEDSSSTEKSKV